MLNSILSSVGVAEHLVDFMVKICRGQAAVKVKVLCREPALVDVYVYFVYMVTRESD